MHSDPDLSVRLRHILEALPLRPGLRVLEIGGAPGPLARAIAARVAPDGFVLVVDRSEAGTSRTADACAREMAAGLLGVRCSPIESFTLDEGEPRFDLALANRVGAFDGRHPDLLSDALRALEAATVEGSQFFVDGVPWSHSGVEPI